MAPETLDVLREVGHRLRTPLATVHGYANLLEEHLVDDRVDPVTLAGWARRIQAETERLAGLLADLSRLRSLSGPLRSAPLDLQAVVAEAVQLAQSESDQPIWLDDGPPVTYIGDATLLRRAIYHLLYFALRRPQTPRVRVAQDEPTRVEIDLPAGWSAAPSDVWWLLCERVLEAHAGRLEEHPQALVLVLG